MNCIFFGHRDTSEQIYENLKNAIRSLIIYNGINTFFIGNNGSFDLMCQKVLSELSEVYDSISYTILLSRINEIALNNEQENTVFPVALEKVPYRYAISKRNDILISLGDVAIVFVKHNASNAYKLMTKAYKKGLKVINISSAEF